MSLVMTKLIELTKDFKCFSEFVKYLGNNTAAKIFKEDSIESQLGYFELFLITKDIYILNIPNDGNFLIHVYKKETTKFVDIISAKDTDYINCKLKAIISAFKHLDCPF